MILQEKKDQIINSFQFQVLDDLKFALSTSYDMYSFNKCQVDDCFSVNDLDMSI
ncbi:hypothetical protein [Holdemanella sp.]|uniref:hypothetical protein n=1 Tax=Holdemanella sp. TaxID=1971762 RepID=UPI002585371B|nr:hypothetical protein [Holdemanella sp.]